ncbi:SH3 domain-containing protein [Natrinema altunense]|uniref:hypothetical protein n=1 Tax=Natrinema altunense TaxID=222984 RepID=UPI001186D8F5|nr:hypothetical protein [Natrinema altunense]
MSGEESSGLTRRSVIKTSGVTLAAGGASVAAVGGASASHNEINPGDIVSLRNDNKSVDTFETLDFENRESYPSGTSGKVVKSEQKDDQKWYLVDIAGTDRWVSSAYVQFERNG